MCSDPFGSLLELFPQAQSFYDASVPFDVLLHQVVQQTPALADHFQQAPAGMMVLLVVLQVFGQIADPFGQDGDLDFRRSGILFIDPIGFDEFFLSVPPWS